MPQAYRDIRLAIGVFGYPTLALRNASTGVIGDWTGYLTLFDLDTGNVLRRADVGSYVCKPDHGTLQSVAIEPQRREWCCVATRMAFAALWNMDKSEILKIHSATYAPVNATTFSPSEQLLVIGTGMYPIDGSERMAAVEVWGKYGGEKWVCLRTARLPGVSCDALHWTPDGGIVAVVGTVSQQESFVVWLDPDDLHIEALCRVDAAGPCHGRVAPVISGGRRAVAGLRDRIVLLDLEERRPILWSREIDGGGRFAYDNEDDRILTTGGYVLCASSGEVTDRLPALQGCEDIALRPNRGFVGVSQNGVVRCWDF